MKTNVWLLAALLLIYGFSYMLTGASQLSDFVRHGGPPGLIVINFAIGMTSLLLGLGLFMTREWARKAWLVASVVLTLFHVLWLVLLYLNGSNLVGHTFYLALTSALTLISLVYLTRSSVRKLFS